MWPLLPLIVGRVGQIAGNAAGGAANQRIRENEQRMQQAHLQNADAVSRGQLQSSDAMNRAGLDLQRRQFAQQEPSVQARQAMTGNLLSRIQPLQMSGLSSRVQSSMPRMNSIIDALGPEARSAGSLLAQRGLSGLQSGPTQFDPLPALNLPPAIRAAMKEPGLLEKILGIGGLVGSTVGALGNLNSVSPTSGNGLPIDPYGGG